MAEEQAMASMEWAQLCLGQLGTNAGQDAAADAWPKIAVGFHQQQVTLLRVASHKPDTPKADCRYRLIRVEHCPLRSGAIWQAPSLWEHVMKASIESRMDQQPWNKGRLVSQKAPLRFRDLWAIRVRLQLRHAARDFASFDLAIDRKLRACDLVKLRVRDVAHGDRVAQRATVLQ